MSPIRKFQTLLTILLSLTLVLTLTACGAKRVEEPAEPNTVTITFPEGSTVLQIAQALEEKGVCSAAEFETACRAVPAGYDRLFGNYDPTGKLFALEGYLFPDTYEFYLNTDAQTALKRFLDNTNAKITDEDLAAASNMGWTLDQVITLASVIQTEAGDPAEMPKVASVFHNRLSSPSFPYLGSDVTRQYIEVKMKEYIQSQGLDYSALFGSYCTNDGYDRKTMGLPVGAICNPGKHAIDATLHPHKDKYYYFFTDPQGGYHYNEDFNSHATQYNAYQNMQSTTSSTTGKAGA